jgi:integrase
MEERSLDSDPHASEEKPGAAKACAEAADVLDLVSANTTDKFNLLLEECREPHLRLYIEIAIETGGRKGAILDLQWDTE